MADGQDPSIFELAAVCENEEAAIQFCREEGLIPMPVVQDPNGRANEYWGVCGELGFNPALPNCGGKVTTRQRMFKNGPKPYYRCVRCRKTLSQQHGLAPCGEGSGRATFFADVDRSGRPNSKISKRAVLWIIYSMSKNLGLDHTVSLAGEAMPVTMSTVISWRNCVRQVMVEALESAPRMGGPGQVVQIGQALFRGRVRTKGPGGGVRRKSPEEVGPWVFGMLHEETGEFRVFHVEERDAASLLQLLVANVAPRTTVLSDGGAVYSGVQLCRDTLANGFGPMHYGHRSGPGVAAALAPLERQWRRCKLRLMKLNRGTSPAMLPGHLAAFWWDSLHGPARCRDPFLRLVGLIRERYPLA